ncbi:hypothetical protein IJX73_00145 [bacterium]|nr:hypothetical protein [bacterium]MBQ9149320.1 hypothetical protein [bacterium]
MLINTIKAINIIIKLLSNNKAFFSLEKSNFGLRKVDFLILKNDKEITKLNMEKIKAFISVIAPNKESISIFSTIKEKNEINIIK